MKTPEEYIEQAEKDYNSTLQESPMTVSEMALKSMQEDHQREMDEVLHSAIRTIKELLTMAEVPHKDRSYYYQHLQDYLTNFQQQDR